MPWKTSRKEFGEQTNIGTFASLDDHIASATQFFQTVTVREGVQNPFPNNRVTSPNRQYIDGKC